MIKRITTALAALALALAALTAPASAAPAKAVHSTSSKCFLHWGGYCFDGGHAHRIHPHRSCFLHWGGYCFSHGSVVFDNGGRRYGTGRI